MKNRATYAVSFRHLLFCILPRGLVRELYVVLHLLLTGRDTNYKKTIQFRVCRHVFDDRMYSVRSTGKATSDSETPATSVTVSMSILRLPLRQWLFASFGLRAHRTA
jgi:hypothetical protein